jgi:serine/threonine protein kinase
MNSSGLKIVEPTDLPDVVCGYKRKEFLGAGSFGYVYKGQHEVTEGLVAIKFIDRRKIYEEQSEFIR